LNVAWRKGETHAIEVEAFHNIPLFSTLSRGELEHIAAISVERHYDRGEVILLEGEMGGALHYVRSGLVKVYKTSPDRTSITPASQPG
jgi:CRP-like cAMP-binding protein